MRAVPTTSSSLRRWSSIVSRLPAAVEAKPHWGAADVLGSELGPHLVLSSSFTDFLPAAERSIPDPRTDHRRQARPVMRSSGHTGDVRTTLAIDDRLLMAARAAARRRGCTLGRLIEESLRRELDQPSAVDLPPVPVFRGGTGPQPGVDLRSNRALADLLHPVDADRRA
jgi:hypothetical protein